jgi:glycosyltransferase involved in cell wall biosynthesis
VPTYRRPVLLVEALDSLRAQTMPRSDFEVIVVNDGGDTLPGDILAGLTGHVVELPVNGGLSHALNLALSHATAPCCTVAADDDLVLPDKLTALCDALDAAPPETVATFGLPIYTTAEGRSLGCPEVVAAFARRHPVVTSAVARAEGMWVHGTALVYRTAAIRDAGGWDETLPTAEEFDLHHRLLRYYGDFRFVDAEVVTYRAGGKHVRYKTASGKRPRAVMDRIYAKLGPEAA